MRIFVAASLVLGLASSALAKPAKFGPATAPKAIPQPFVSGFTPTSGPPGTLVTLTGGSFSAGLRIGYADRLIEVAYLDDSTLQFAVPAHAGTATLQLRTADGANVSVGQFTVTIGPVIDGFAPSSGPVGTRVELVGSGFGPEDTITLAGQVVPVVERSRGHIVVAVPDGARSGPFVIAGTVSPRPFSVTANGPPFVTRIEPRGGRPGDKVTIHGGNFSATDTVRYGDAVLPVDTRSEHTLQVTLPDGIRGNERFVVGGPRGEASAPAVFQLGPPIAIRSFAPHRVGAGRQVEILGSGFVRGDEVHLGDRVLAVAEATENRLVVAVPNEAQSGPLTIVRNGEEIARATETLEILRERGGPILDGFAPTTGPPGTEVTLTGQRLSPDLHVAYGDAPVPILTRTRTSVTLQVPRNAKADAPFVATDKDGTTRSASWFQLALAPQVESVSPTSGPPGTALMIHGHGLRGDEVFYLAEQPLRTLERDARGLRVEVPRAPSGPLSFVSSGQRVQTPFRFDVAEPLVVESIHPPMGPPGTQVTLHGPNLGGVVLVSYGTLPCPIVKRTRDELVIEIPPEAAATDHFWLDAYGQRIESHGTFRVDR